MAATCSGNLYGCRTTLPTDVNADSGAFPELCLTVCPVVLIRNMEVGTKQSHEIAPINSNLTSSHSATVQGRVKRRSQISVVSGVKRTHDALNFIGKQNPGLVIDAGATNSSEYVKYSKNTSERVIKLHEVAQDPLSPPKFRQKKTPLGRISPPKVVLHSPPRLLEEAERSQWNIPPAISNWKVYACNVGTTSALNTIYTRIQKGSPYHWINALPLMVEAFTQPKSVIISRN